jgi:hypothetical protein
MSSQNSNSVSHEHQAGESPMRRRPAAVRSFTFVVLIAVMASVFAFGTADECCISLFGNELCGNGSGLTAAPDGGGINPGPTPTPVVGYTKHETYSAQDYFGDGTFGTNLTIGAYVTDAGGSQHPFDENDVTTQLEEDCDSGNLETKLTRVNSGHDIPTDQFNVYTGYATAPFGLACPVWHAIAVQDGYTQANDNPSIDDTGGDWRCHSFPNALGNDGCALGDGGELPQF